MRKDGGTNEPAEDAADRAASLGLLLNAFTGHEIFVAAFTR